MSMPVEQCSKGRQSQANKHPTQQQAAPSWPGMGKASEGHSVANGWLILQQPRQMRPGSRKT